MTIEWVINSSMWDTSIIYNNDKYISELISFGIILGVDLNFCKRYNIRDGPLYGWHFIYSRVYINILQVINYRTYHKLKRKQQRNHSCLWSLLCATVPCHCFKIFSVCKFFHFFFVALFKWSPKQHVLHCSRSDVQEIVC